MPAHKQAGKEGRPFPAKSKKDILLQQQEAWHTRLVAAGVVTDVLLDARPQRGRLVLQAGDLVQLLHLRQREGFK